MKKIFFVLALTIVYSTSFSQDYLQKSKNQKKTAWIMLGGGGVLLLTGIIIPKGELVHENFWYNEYKNDGIKGAFLLTGTLSMLGSIPFFITSSKNKRRAGSFSFKNERIRLLNNGRLIYNDIPSFRLKINL